MYGRHRVALVPHGDGRVEVPEDVRYHTDVDPALDHEGRRDVAEVMEADPG